MSPESQHDSSPIRYVELGVGGMHCADCVRTVADALESVPGVRHADVSLEDRSARVTAEPAVDPTRLAAAVRASGYSAFVRSAGDAA